ncbi:unnamed protein product [Paramecium sonneborni]|uniref:SET domain-containing protein n=1 Tax=Paramecium sonneborni TaxID=65129 RepID=A0A8S1LDG8_9CILI|nr:unnamed protein product [Paramecium sonneborni]
MQLDQTQTDDIKQHQKYKLLQDWGIKNGVKMKGVKFQEFFGDVTGMIALEDLPSNTAIICIPQSLIISPNKCKRSNLVSVYNSHPEMFDEEETNNADFNILTFYMYNEKKKGESSFYYSYIQAIQTNNTLLGWSNDDLNKIEDPIILEEFTTIKQDVLGLWGKAKLIFDNNQDVFGIPRVTDKKDFYWAVECVMSRCFGWALRYTCLIPIADFLNHSNRACTHYMVHQRLEQGNGIKSVDKMNYEQQYIIKRNKINLSILDIENENDMQIYEDQKNKYIIQNKEYIRDDYQIEYLNRISQNEKRIIINKIQYEQLMKDEQLNIWELDSVTSSDSEDNDSDEEIKLEKQKQFEILKIKEFAELKLREEQKRIQREQEQQSLQNQRIVTVTLDPKNKNKVIIRGLPQYQIEAIKVKQQMMNGRLWKDGKESKEYDDDDDESEKSEESKWDWLDEYDEDAYFCIVTTVPIKKYEQVTISYGRRTNRFLLCWYGFALEQNLYSSFNFRLWLNNDILQERNREQILNTIIIKKLISVDESIVDKITYNGYEIPVSSLSKEIRIKKNHLNMDVIIFLRLLLQMQYGNEKELLSIIPVSIDYEIFVMQFYDSMLNHLLNSYSQDLIQDLKELEQQIEIPKRFAIYINKERKEILINQINIVTEAIKILKKYKEIGRLKDSYLLNDKLQNIQIIKALKRYLQLINEFL